MGRVFVAALAAAIALAAVLSTVSPVIGQTYDGASIVHVPNHAALLATPPSATRVTRDGFTGAGDGGAVSYRWNASACSLNSGAGDSGSQVPGLGGGCWIAELPPFANAHIWGVDATGVSDSSSAITAGLNATAETNGCLLLPAGRYWVNAGATFSGRVCLWGVGWSEDIPSNNPLAAGTWLKITNSAIAPFTFTGSGARGSLIRELAVEQIHPAPGDRWTPVAYQPVFTVTDALGEVRFENLYFPGVYQGIYSYNSGRTTLRHIRGQTFSYLAFIDNPGGSDTNHIDDIHIWTYWSSDPNVTAWQQANGDVIKFGRVDSVDSDHIFGLGYKSCIHFAGNASAGPATGIHIGSVNCDASLYPVWDTDATSFGLVSYGTEADIGQLQCSGGLAGSNCIELDGKNARLAVGAVIPVNIMQSVVNITSNSAALGNIVRLQSIMAQGGTIGFNNNGTGTYPVFNVVANSGFPHQIALASPVVPSNGGNTNSRVTSGIINVTTAAGSPILYAPQQAWYNPTVTNSSTNQIPNWVDQYLPSGAGIHTITFKLPDRPVDGKEITIISAHNMNGIKIDGGGFSVFGPTVSSLTANTPVKFKFLQPIFTWWRVQ